MTPSLTSSEYSRTCPETKIAPKMYVRTYHSRMPHELTCHRRVPARWALPCSAAWTPSWHHTEEITRIRVLAVAYGMLSMVVRSFHRSGSTPRIVKYIANRPAKNMSSLASHTIVPTETMLGLVTGP